MPDSAGTYTLAEPGPVNGNTGDATPITANFEDMEDALTARLMADGTKTSTANQPMGGFRHTNVGTATARTMYAQAAQVADSSLTYGGVAGGTADALTIAPSPAISAYAIGQKFQFKVSASANTGAATLNVNAVGAGAVTWPDGTALVAGDLPASGMVTVSVQAVTPVFHLETQTRAAGTLPPTSTITSTDAGAGAAPTLNLFRNSASPAASDVLGEVSFTGKDSGGGTDTYARIYTDIVDATAASEDGRLNFETKIAGTAAQRGYVGHGLVMGSATGGDKGAGTANLQNLYINGAKSGGLVALTAIDLTGASQADIVLDTTNYRALFIVFDAVVVTSDGASVVARVSVDGGSTFISTGSYVHVRNIADAAASMTAAGSNGDSSMIVAAAVDSTAGQNLSGSALLIIGGAAANATKLEWSVGYQNSSGNATKVSGYGSNPTASQVDALRFLPSTSTFASGFIYPYAILK